ncbi:MAG: 50S ribosomal protein L5 [Patescibacteria group bacterium]|nr:50S ribosomal protein L5 [Patescibacteria group bacterium]
MLFEEYDNKIAAKVREKTGIRNPWALPRVIKVVINMRVSEGKENRQTIDLAAKELELITGQKPQVCCAKKAISGFKLRKGDPIGLKVTLRRKKMLDFLEKLFSLALPRLRDFRGLAVQNFDREGNFNIGLKEQTIFPEIDLDEIKVVRGLQVTIVTNVRDIESSRLLLETLGLPFKKEE